MSKFPPLFKYLLYSIFATVFDVVIVWILYRQIHINIVLANTIGVTAGFIVQYLLASKSVFSHDYGVLGFAIYLGTFLFGLVLADGLIFLGKYCLFNTLQYDLGFFLSKGLSIVVPFFILYFLRKVLFGLIKKDKGEDNSYGKYC